MFDPKLKIGEVINNDTLCRIFHCSPQGGMRKSNTTNTLVIIANYVKGIYHDKWIGGVLHYTGMGLNGDQNIDYMQNYTLYHADKLSIDVFLFEVMEEKEYTYCGKVHMVDNPYTEIQLDENGNKRKVWMFPVRPVPDNDVIKPLHYVFKDMADYKNRGQNVDREYADYRKQLKKKYRCISQIKPDSEVIQQEEMTIDTAKVLQNYAWLRDKRVNHKIYGVGIITKLICGSNGTINIVVKFDKEMSGLTERTLGYEFCMEKELIEILS